MQIRSDAYKWGLNTKQINVMTLVEYDEIALAMYEKEQEDLAKIRLIRTDILNWAGNGSSKVYQPEQVMGIPFIDNQNATFPIRSLEDALSLLKEFED